MTTLDDLVPLAADRLMVLDEWRGKEGSTWDWTFGLLDDAGAAVSCTGWTVACKVLDKIDGTVLVTLTGTVSSTGFRVTATAASTSDLAGTPNEYPNGRPCVWSARATKGASVIDLWGPDEFLITSDLTVTSW